MEKTEFKHYTVMKNEAVEGLNPKDGLIYLDGTLGGGGHSELIAQKISPSGKLFIRLLKKNLLLLRPKFPKWTFWKSVICKNLINK